VFHVAFLARNPVKHLDDLLADDVWSDILLELIQFDKVTFFFFC
jgi:hypothetical protein